MPNSFAVRLRASRSRWLSSTIAATVLLSAHGGAEAQDQSTPSTSAPATPPGPATSNLPPVTVVKPVRRAVSAKPTRQAPPAAVSRQAPAAPTTQTLFGGLIPAGTTSVTNVPQVAPGVPGPNLNAIATSATRLDLPLRDTPASVDVITQQTMQDQGYRTNVEVAQGAVGVTAINPGGAQGGFSMRGFSGDAINHLYNGISIGIQDLTGRAQDTFNFDRIEFLKGASAIESGVGSIGGAVNYVTKQPFSGPVLNETFISVDSFRGVRSGFDSGGSTSIPGLDYRVTASFDDLRGFIDDTHKDVSTLTARWNYKNSDVLRTWIAFEYYNDQGNQYWGTPLVPLSGPGATAFPTPGVVSGSRGVTVDSRTLTTNYNTLDNHDSAKQYWGRTGFDLEIAPNLLLKEQAYLYTAQRTFFDDEFFSFNSAPNQCTTSPACVDRNPFYVSHNQRLIGDVTNLTWDSSFFGMPNKFAAEVAASRNFLRFTQQSNFTSTTNTVSLIDPARGFFGPLQTQEFTTQLDSVSESFEERLKVTPTIALIGGVRIDELKITNNGPAAAGNFPVSKSWEPVSYRAAATWEPIEKLVFYGLYGTSYDPAVAPIQLAGFQAASGFPLTLTSSRIEEVGVKQSLWNNRAEWTFAAFDLDRRNVLEVVSSPPPVFGIAGDIESKGIELGGAIRPVDGLKLWGNVAYTHARFGSDILEAGTPGTPTITVNGNTPPNVAPIIVNAGASYRFEPRIWPTPWPVEIGASVRHVGSRYTTEFNDVIMDNYTVADAYMFIDFEKPSGLPSVDKTRLAFRVRNLTNKTYADFVDPGTPNQVYLGAPRSYEAALSFKFGPTAQPAHLDPGYGKAPPLLFDWRGFYLGGNVGGAFSEEKAPTPLGSSSPNPSGVLGGIQLGYNFVAAPNWLIGIEGELGWTSAQGTVVIPDPVATATVTSNHNWYDTFGGRFGFFQGPWLYYVKGGAAWLNADYRLTGNFNGVTALQSVTDTRSGWTVGAGIEYMWAPNWSAKAEYDFLDFGTRNLGFGALGTTIGVNTNVHEIKVGFNYRWLPGTLFGGL